MREIVLPPDEASKRLENFLKKEFPIGHVRKIFRRNAVRLNGKRAKPDDPIRGGDRVQLFIDYERPSAPRAQPARFAVVYEDEGLLVVNKPAGLAVHEGKTVRKKDSLLGLLEARYRERGIKPELVHRLDRDTSGLLLVAKDARTAAELIGRFETGAVGKEYLCLVVGRLSSHEGRIDFPLPGREGQPVRALTRYRVIKKFSDTTLVRVVLETGRLHQIRLHFAKLGHPVVLDDQHGDFAFNKRFRKEYGLKRQFLHAETLKADYRGRAREWAAPLAKDLDDTLRALESTRD